MLRDIISFFAHCHFYISQNFVELLKEESPGSSKVYLASIEYKQYFLQELYHVQGADNKLGQFLIQDIYAMANHRNCLRHLLESCPSLV
jgi:hypothetical protein